jgi:hypothetical protein
MVRNIEVVSLQEIVWLWDDNRLDAKLADGTLYTIVAADDPAVNPLYGRGRSRIVKVYTQNAQHVGTFHEIVLPDGSVPHRHPKDYTRRDCSRVRVASEPVTS